MSNTNKKVAAVQVEGTAPTGEESTKVIQMETETKTVSQMMNKASGLMKASKDLDGLYLQRERFNSMFFGLGEGDAQEIKHVFLQPASTENDTYLKEKDCFKVKNPATLVKIRAIVAIDMGEMIEDLENQIVNFKI